MTVDSTAGLVCVGGSGCGTTIVPFDSVSWISNNKQAGPNAGLDIQNGSFNGSANQSLVNLVLSPSVTLSNVLVFQYNNSTLYPAGQYRGRVIYTASVL